VIKTEEKTLFYRKGSTISVINGQELITIPIAELNLRVDILRKQTIDEFVEKCVGEMKQWCWNEELHSKTDDPLIIDDMIANAIVTIRQIANEMK